MNRNRKNTAVCRFTISKDGFNMQGAETGDAGEAVQGAGGPLQVHSGTGCLLCLISHFWNGYSRHFSAILLHTVEPL
jgi:hypothetical protein